MDDCESKSNFNISGQNVTYQEFSTCANYEQYSGSYNNDTKKMILSNYNNQSSTNFDVELVNNEMFVKNTQTVTVGGQTNTLKYTFICSK